MSINTVLCVLNAKYIHASPAPWCLAAGVKEFCPNLYENLSIIEATINLPFEQIIEEINAKKPDVLGFSCYIWNVEKTLIIAKKIKEINKNITIVLGGPEVSFRAKNVLENHPFIDFILKGEGEKSFACFLEMFNNNKSNLYCNTSAVNGLCGRLSDGSIFENEPEFLDGNIPSPINAGYDAVLKHRLAYIETSRGCPYSCAFCLSGGCGKPRYFDLKSTFQNILTLANSGTKTVKFVDRTFNANQKHANAILQFILDNYGTKIPLGTCFHFEVAGDILKTETKRLLSLMPVGAVQLEIGLQSFNEETLASVNRKTNIKVLCDNIVELSKFGNMHLHIDLIAGLPYENLEIFKQSYNKAYSLKAQMLQLGFLKLLYGSEMRTNTAKYPLKFSANPPYQITETPWLSETDLEALSLVEDATERIYNSGRFKRTADYLVNSTGLTPFDLYYSIGKAFSENKLTTKLSLNEFTSFLLEFAKKLPNINPNKLRDLLLLDRISTIKDVIPPCLNVKDSLLSRAVKKLASNPLTAPKKGVKRTVALIYTENSVCYVDYISCKKNPVTAEWNVNKILLSDLFEHN